MSRDPIEEAGGLNLYGFIDNDPLNQWDRLGLWIETAWDAANVAADIVSLGDNLWNGNWGDAGVDAGGLILDGLSTAIPAVPAIAGPMIRAKRATQKVVKEAAEKTAKEAAEKAAKKCPCPTKAFSKEKQALVDMAKKDKKLGVTQADMDAYKQLNEGLLDPFPEDMIRGLETHPKKQFGQHPHGHVGPVNHIPQK